MAWRCIITFILVSFLSFPSTGISQANTEINPELLPLFYKLWKDSAFGKSPARIERAGWVVQRENGELIIEPWPTSGERNKEYWRGPVPEGTIAQAHTHTVITDPKPAPKDIELAKRTGLPLYTISGQGIWMVDSGGKITRVADHQWYRNLR